MSFTIICIGLPEKPVQGTYTSAGFDAAVHAELGSAVLPYNGRRYNPDGKQIWLGEGMPAQDTANKILLPCSPVIDQLLNEIPLRSSPIQTNSILQKPGSGKQLLSGSMQIRARSNPDKLSSSVLKKSSKRSGIQRQL